MAAVSAQLDFFFEANPEEKGQSTNWTQGRLLHSHRGQFLSQTCHPWLPKMNQTFVFLQSRKRKETRYSSMPKAEEKGNKIHVL